LLLREHGKQVDFGELPFLERFINVFLGTEVFVPIFQQLYNLLKFREIFIVCFINV